MVLQNADRIMTDTFTNEHEIILRQSSQVCEFAHNQIAVLITDFQDKNLDLPLVEKIIAWKSTLKRVLWNLDDYLRDHVERETAFLSSSPVSTLDPTELKRNEDVLEHIDELSWLLDNTPARKIFDFLEYIKQKVNELDHGVQEHCRRGNEALKLTE